MKFRYDINGLRAYAVILVVLFHFGVLGFSAGFIGVDIFFVISGFLMTKIIVSGIKKESFTLFKFYLSRAIRIIPALAFLIASVATIGWFTLIPQEYKEYALHSISSLSFISNIIYFKESGYFDASSHEKLLLHTWSLSVEWQFYILLPIFLLILSKLSKSLNLLKAGFLLGLAISLALSIKFSYSHATAAFYLLPTRAWEMMAGGLLYLFFNNVSFSKPMKGVIEGTGFLLILISMWLLTPKSMWPSYNALLPVIGTFLILLAQNNNSVLTNNKVAQFLGNTSYSIYLWHWPLVFYLAYFEKSNQTGYIVISIALSILLGWLSFRFVENPTQKFLTNLSASKAYICTIGYLSIMIIGLGITYKLQGLPNRFNSDVNSLANAVNDKNPRRSECHLSTGAEIPKCKYGNGDVGVIVVGDSHAQAIIRSVEKSMPRNKPAVIDWTYSSCPTILGTKNSRNDDYKCGEVVNSLIKDLPKYPNIPVLITNRLNAYFEGDQIAKSEIPIIYSGKAYNSFNQENKQNLTEGFIKTVCEISKTNPVYITTQIPEQLSNIPKTLAHRRIFNNLNDISIPLHQHIQRSEASNNAIYLAAKKCGATVLDVTPYLCKDGKCSASSNGKPAYYDDDHLSETGAQKLIPLFQKIQ
ncbi:acyltransferase family protein [Acinetobacter guillouiae]|uniref:acyltransferase family protein n=1 Tax=Acinetobacter guillouiae TaxID=106649 RepID=UPI003AF7CDEF